MFLCVLRQMCSYSFHSSFVNNDRTETFVATHLVSVSVENGNCFSANKFVFAPTVVCLSRCTGQD